jgi:hypothetical protein
MPAEMGVYDHMNAEDPVVSELTIDELARKLEKMNYGTHRLLSALVRLRRASPETERHPYCRMLTDAIENALNKGGF